MEGRFIYQYIFKKQLDTINFFTCRLSTGVLKWYRNVPSSKNK